MSWRERVSRALASWEPTQDPREALPGPCSIPYRCLDCGKRFGGPNAGVRALAHHRSFDPHHRIDIPNMARLGPLHFSCCPPERP